MKGFGQRTYGLACKLFNYFRVFAKHWNENHASMRAAALTYTFILSLVPALAICLWCFSLFADVNIVQTELKNFLLKNLATGTGQSVVRLIDQGLRNTRFKTIGYIGFAGMFLTGWLLLAAIQESMNRIWKAEIKQRMWKRVLLYQAFFSLGPIGIAMLMVALAFVTKFFPSFFYPAKLASIFLATLLFTAMYKLLPVPYVKWKNALISGFLAACAVELAKRGFAIYTARALFYSKVYGGLAALPFFLIWVYLNWTIFLAGTQLNYILDHSHRLFSRKDNAS